MASPKKGAFVWHIFLYISRCRTLHIGASIGAGSLKEWEKNFKKTLPAHNFFLERGHPTIFGVGLH